MKILLMRTWLTNIGNGFIDKGARALLEDAVKDAEIIEASGYPNYFFDHKRAGPVRGLDNVVGEVGQRIENTYRSWSPVEGNILNIGQLVDVDVAVIPGCVLYEFALGKFEPVLENLRKNEVPIIFLGAGGAEYDATTRRYMERFIKRNRIAGLITRDGDAYRAYSDLVSRSYRGIDCGFFIDDWYSPSDADETFVTATFDKTEEPDIEPESTVVRPTHTPFSDLSNVIGLAKEVVPGINHRGPSDVLNDQNTFLSDSIEDYLFIYANASETHSDRIHACVPALAYGNAARFYYSTPRAGLFDEILETDISTSLTTVDRQSLNERKREQAANLQTILEEAT